MWTLLRGPHPSACLIRFYVLPTIILRGPWISVCIIRKLKEGRGEEWEGDRHTHTLTHACRHTHTDTDYGESAHVVIEAKKSQDVLLASWRPGDLMFPFQSGGRKSLMAQLRQSGRWSSLSLEGGPAFLFYSGHQLIGWGPPTSRKAIFFTLSTNSDVNLT